MSPPPSPNGKSSTRSSHARGIILLLGLILLAFLIGGLVFYQLYPFEGENSANKEDDSSSLPLNNSQPHFDPTIIVPIVGRPNQMETAVTERTTTPTTTVTTTESTTARTTTISFPEEGHAEVVIEEEEEDESKEEEETAQPTEDIIVDERENPSKSEDEVNQCAALPIERTSCGHVQRLPIPASFTPLSLLHYSLNLTTSYVGHFIGDSEIFIKPKAQTNQIILGATRNLRSLDSVTVLDCTSGEAICSSIQHDPSQEVLSISLSTPTSSLLRVIINQYHSISASSLYSQVPAAFNRQLPSVVGTHFQSDSDAKQLFPTVLGSGIRSPLSLCLFHDESDSVSSLTPSEGSIRYRRDAPEGKKTTCFEKTKAIQQRDFAFLAHYKTESLFFNRTSSSMPELDVVFSFTQGFSPSHHEWIHEETQKVISAVSEWTSFGFPLNRLTLIDAPIPVSHPVSPLGFVVLKSGSLLGNPKVAMMRNSLMRQVISQWIGGVVSSDSCVENALVTYLQWTINDEIAFIPSQPNTTEKIRDTRPSSLVSKPKRGRLSLSSSSPCPDRLPSIFHSIDRIYGEGTIQRVVKNLFIHHSFSHIPLSQLASIVSDVTGDETAGVYLRDWFTVSSRPLFLARKTREGMNLTQVAAPNKEVNLWRLPLEMEGSVMEVKPELNQFLPLSSPPIDCLVIDPRRKSTAMIAYDVSTYQCLIRCSFSSLCSLSPIELDSIFADLGVFFTSNLLPVDKKELSNWKSVLTSLQSRSSLQGESKCCLDHSLRTPPSRDCAWTVNDICKKIDLSSSILSSA